MSKKRRTRPNGASRPQDMARQGSANRTRQSGRQNGSAGSRNQSARRADNSIQFPTGAARSAHTTGGQERPHRTSSGTASYPGGQRRQGTQGRGNTQSYPNSRAASSAQRQRHPNTGSNTPQGRLRPTEDNLRSPSRRERRKKRRLTRAAVRRQRAMRRVTALALLLCVIAAGVYLTVTMLFKISAIRVQTADGTVVDTAGGYSSSEIIQTLGVQIEQNIFSFDPGKKADALEKAYPCLENIAVVREYPGTVVVRVTEATPAYAMQTDGGWLTLSAQLKILARDTTQPDLPTLWGGEPVSTTPGDQLTFALEAPASSAASDSADSAESDSAAEQTPTDNRLDSLYTLLSALDTYDLRADTTRIEFAETDQMAFLYQGRVSVLLGTLNELDYKLKMAQYVLSNTDGKGVGETDTGMLDLSHLSASSTRKFRFAQGEPTLPSGYIAAPVEAAPETTEAAEPTAEASGEAPAEAADTAADAAAQTPADAAPAENANG